MNINKNKLIETISKRQELNEVIGFFSSNKPAVIFGAGRQAGILYGLCKMYQKEIAAILTTSTTGRWSSLPGEDKLAGYTYADDLSALRGMDCILGVGNADGIAESLSDKGLSNIYSVKNWSVVNDILREVFFDEFVCENDGIIDLSLDEPVIRYKDFKMYYPKNDAIFKAATLGEFNNIVMPSVWGCHEYETLGGYELPGCVEVERGDTVLDLGANIGMFSCVAASKGAQVYSVEPYKMLVDKYLSRNASLNNYSIHVDNLLIGEKNQEVLFYYNDELDANQDVCRGSVHREKEPSYTSTEVMMMSLDEYVELKRIIKVDYIKAHIENYEYEMLIGAKKVIMKNAPKIAMFYPGASTPYYKKIEELLLSYNSAYKFKYFNNRFFAYT